VACNDSVVDFCNKIVKRKKYVNIYVLTFCQNIYLKIICNNNLSTNTFLFNIAFTILNLPKKISQRKKSQTYCGTHSIMVKNK